MSVCDACVKDSEGNIRHHFRSEPPYESIHELDAHHAAADVLRADNDTLRHALTQIAEWLERGRVMYSEGFMSSEARRILKETGP